MASVNDVPRRFPVTIRGTASVNDVFCSISIGVGASVCLSRSSSESLSPRGRCRVCYCSGPGVFFSMGKSDLCLAGAGGSNRASGSRGIPRKSFEAVRGTTAIDDVTVFDIIPGPELLVEQGCFPVVSKWRWQGASGSEGVPRKCPSHRSGKNIGGRCYWFCSDCGP